MKRWNRYAHGAFLPMNDAPDDRIIDDGADDASNPSAKDGRAEVLLGIEGEDVASRDD